MNNHLTYFEIKNFKKFKSLEIKDLGQFNLITGDNNVGKTTLLEALLVDDSDDKSIEFLHRTLCNKNFHLHPQRVHSKNPIFPDESYFKFLKNDKSKGLSFKWIDAGGQHSLYFEDCVLDDLVETDFLKRKEDNYGIGKPKNWIKIYKNGEFKELQWMYLDDFRRDLKYGYWPLIAFNAGYQDDINKYYEDNIGGYEGEVIEGNQHAVNQLELKFKTLDYEQKESFISTLSMFVKDIEDTTIRNYYGRDILSIKTKAIKDYQPITFWGEGFNKFVRYLLEIVQCKNNRIMIDEIDTGVHWTKQIKFWDNIIKACVVNDVQLFATTHSSDCVRAFAEVAKIFTEVEKDIRLIEVEEFVSKQDFIIHKATSYNYDTLTFKLETETNVRGGDVWQ